jgi:hypothetical protein
VTLAFPLSHGPIGWVSLARLESKRRVSTCPHVKAAGCSNDQTWFGLLRNRAGPSPIS